MGNRRFGGFGIYLLILVLIYFGITNLNKTTMDKSQEIDLT
ncbi:MAG: hypothetical protein QMB54_04510 [Neofamilia sp.]